MFAPLTTIGPDEGSATVQEREALAEIGITAETATSDPRGELSPLTLEDYLAVDELISRYEHDYPRYHAG